MVGLESWVANRVVYGVTPTTLLSYTFTSTNLRKSGVQHAVFTVGNGKGNEEVDGLTEGSRLGF